MARYLRIRKHEENDNHALYYFTDYSVPIHKLSQKISECIEGFIQIDKHKCEALLKECSDEQWLDNPKKWVVECALMKTGKAAKNGSYPDILDFNS